MISNLITQGPLPKVNVATRIVTESANIALSLPSGLISAEFDRSTEFRNSLHGACSHRLKHHLKRKLRLPRTRGRWSDEHAAAGERGSGAVEKLRPRLRGRGVVYVIEQVEEFRTKLKIEGL